MSESLWLKAQISSVDLNNNIRKVRVQAIDIDSNAQNLVEHGLLKLPEFDGPLLGKTCFLKIRAIKKQTLLMGEAFEVTIPMSAGNSITTFCSESDINNKSLFFTEEEADKYLEEAKPVLDITLSRGNVIEMLKQACQVDILEDPELAKKVFHILESNEDNLWDFYEREVINAYNQVEEDKIKMS